MYRRDSQAHGHTRFHKQSFAQLQACFNGFRHGFGGTCFIKLDRVGFIAGARNDLNRGVRLCYCVQFLQHGLGYPW